MTIDEQDLVDEALPARNPSTDEVAGILTELIDFGPFQFPMTQSEIDLLHLPDKECPSPAFDHALLDQYEFLAYSISANKIYCSLCRPHTPNSKFGIGIDASLSSETLQVLIKKHKKSGTHHRSQKMRCRLGKDRQTELEASAVIDPDSSLMVPFVFSCYHHKYFNLLSDDRLVLRLSCIPQARLASRQVRSFYLCIERL